MSFPNAVSHALSTLLEPADMKLCVRPTSPSPLMSFSNAVSQALSLDLTAELTVLSACETALGKDIKGEGLVGLTHSFMSAGSKSVVASLWKVDDRATAILMADFYQSM